MPAAAPRLTFLPDLLEEHIEEVEFLWAQREAAFTSTRRTMRDLAHLDDRIDAHVQGIRAVGTPALALLTERIAGDDVYAVFAGAYPMLRLGDPTAADQVVEAFAAADGPRLAGIRRALAFGAAPAQLAPLRDLLFSANPPVAAAALEVLAFNGASPDGHGRLLLLVRDDAPEVRERAWHAAAFLDTSLDPKLYAAAMRDESPVVRDAALLAAAWCRVPGALAFARQLAERPSLENLRPLELLAVLGTPEDLPRIRALARNPDLGPSRFALPASFGHPALVDDLIAQMAGPDPAAAIGAGEAFTRMTGAGVDSAERVRFPAGGAEPQDDFEAEFQEEALLPDPALARREWDRLKARLASVTRMAGGLDLTAGITAEAAERLDLRSRGEAYLRARYRGQWTGSSRDLQRFPQPAPRLDAGQSEVHIR